MGAVAGDGRVSRRSVPKSFALMPTAEMVSRIRLARLEGAPAICPTCGTHTTKLTRRCYVCTEIKPLTSFVRNTGKALGYGYQCKACKRVASAQYRMRMKVRMFLGAVGRAI